MSQICRAAVSLGGIFEFGAWFAYIIGCWPVPIFGKLICYYNLFVQPVMGVLHALLECPRARDAWVVLRDACPLCLSRDVHLAFLQFIFGEEAPVQNFVGSCFKAILSQQHA